MPEKVPWRTESVNTFTMIGDFDARKSGSMACVTRTTPKTFVS